LKQTLSQIYINSADLVDYKQADGSATKTLEVRIPFRSLPAFRKAAEKIVQHLESKFNWPVIVIANRTIASKWGKSRFHLMALRGIFYNSCHLYDLLLNMFELINICLYS
jgi:hypothetical protein